MIPRIDSDVSMSLGGTNRSNVRAYYVIGKVPVVLHGQQRTAGDENS